MYIVGNRVVNTDQAQTRHAGEKSYNDMKLTIRIPQVFLCLRRYGYAMSIDATRRQPATSTLLVLPQRVEDMHKASNMGASGPRFHSLELCLDLSVDMAKELDVRHCRLRPVLEEHAEEAALERILWREHSDGLLQRWALRAHNLDEPADVRREWMVARDEAEVRALGEPLDRVDSEHSLEE